MVELRRASRDENPLPEAPREWLVANGLGGYASATITGAITRRYHGFLIAAQPAPLGRMVVLNDIEVDIELEDGSVVNLRERARFVDFRTRIAKSVQPFPRIFQSCGDYLRADLPALAPPSDMVQSPSSGYRTRSTMTVMDKPAHQGPPKAATAIPEISCGASPANR